MGTLGTGLRFPLQGSALESLNCFSSPVVSSSFMKAVSPAVRWAFVREMCVSMLSTAEAYRFPLGFCASESFCLAFHLLFHTLFHTYPGTLLSFYSVYKLSLNIWLVQSNRQLNKGDKKRKNFINIAPSVFSNVESRGRNSKYKILFPGIFLAFKNLLDRFKLFL